MPSLKLSDKPVLRDDLHVTPDPERQGFVVLEDPLCGHVHTLSPLAAAIARCLDGVHTLEEIFSAVAQACQSPIPPQQGLALIQDLHQRLLLDDPSLRPELERRQRQRLALQQARRGAFEVHLGQLHESLANLDVRPDLRFDCLCCGRCCSGRFRIQLSPDDQRRLAALDLQGTLGISLTNALTTRIVGGDDAQKPKVFLRHDPQGRCVFLDENQRCRIHTHFGFDAKPIGCKLFPYFPIITPRGATLQFRHECGWRHRSIASGTNVTTHIDALRQLCAQNLHFVLALPLQPRLVGARAVPYDHYDRHRQAWTNTVRQRGWRALLPHVAADLLQPPPSSPKRALRRIFATVVDTYLDGAPLLGEEKAAHTFADVAPEATIMREVLPALLLTLGVVHPDSETRLQELQDHTQRILARLSLWPGSDLDPLLDDYTLSFLDGHFAFAAFTVASGLGLWLLVVMAARRTWAFFADDLDQAQPPELLDAALVAWHMLLFNKEALRAQLLVEASPELEQALALAPELL